MLPFAAQAGGRVVRNDDGEIMKRAQKVGVGLTFGLLVVACGSDIADEAGEMLVDAGEMLVDAGQGLGDASDDAAKAQDHAGVLPGNETTVVLTCDKKWTETVRGPSNPSVPGGYYVRSATTTFYAEVAVGNVSGVDAWTCDRETNTPSLPCSSSRTTDCVESQDPAPVVECQSASVQIGNGKVRVLCGTEVRRKSAVIDGEQPTSLETLTTDRWRTVRLTVRP